MDWKDVTVFTLAFFCIAITASAQEARLIGSGSGFFVSADGYFLTNYHVVEGASEVRIKVRDELVAAKVTKLDPVNDIAVLKAAGEFSIPAKEMH